MQNFREAYEVLRTNAQTLRDQDEPNLDDLLELVNESLKAYRVCKERIDQVDKALAAALRDAPAGGEQGAAPASAPVPRARTAPPAGQDDDDSIPF